MSYHVPRTCSGSTSPVSSVSTSSDSTYLSLAPSPSPSSRGSSKRNTPNRVPIDLPKNQATSRGGCWTCRLRRKKCDEQREGGSCKTCRRLTIECLGWGPKRPDWMRDKQAVASYKADIKAQLTRAGLIRGQPRSSLLQAQARTQTQAKTQPRSTSSNERRPQTYHRSSAPAEVTSATSSPSSLSHDLGLNYNEFYLETDGGLLPGIPGASAFHHLPGASYSDPNINSFEYSSSLFHYSPESTTPLPNSMSNNDHLSQQLDFGFTNMGISSCGFDYELVAPSPAIQSFPLVSGQDSMQEDYVMYYFENCKKLHFIFGENAITNATYNMIMDVPRGALTNAVCSVASLYYTRIRVAQGLEAPDTNPEHSAAKYFYDESYLQLMTAKQVQGRYGECDVIAALHLICYSQMSGMVTDWYQPLAIAFEWLAQSGLTKAESPRDVLSRMGLTSQLVVKITMWMDIFSSVTLMRPPKYMTLYRRFFEDQRYEGLGMENLTGCPDVVMMAIGEISCLSNWKIIEQHKGSLSLRELIRRGDEIEQHLRVHFTESSTLAEPTPLLPNLAIGNSADNSGEMNGKTRLVIAQMFRESTLLYLHTVLSDPNPAVPEISSSVEAICDLLKQLPPSEHDQTLVFPLCIAGCMTDDSKRRDLLKIRLEGYDECRGNMMRAQVLMEGVWQKRDVSGMSVDWREVGRERNLNLLLI